MNHYVSYLCFAVLFHAMAAIGLGMDPPMWESGPADSPSDTRIYFVSNIRKTIAENGWEIGQSVQVMDAPMRVSATITPAKIVYSDPETGDALGVSTFIGMTLFGFNRYREYETDNGYVDLVGRDASIRRVKQLDDGYGEKDFRHGMCYHCQEFTEERKGGKGVGLHVGATPPRGLWMDAGGESPFPGKKNGDGGAPSGGNSSGNPPASMFPAKGGNGGNGNAGGATPVLIPQPAGGAAPGGEPSAQEPGKLTQEQKQLILGDLDIQISNLKAQLKQLQCDRVDAEANLDRAIAINVGVTMAQARVTQIIHQINNTQFRLTMLEQQRMALMSQP